MFETFTIRTEPFSSHLPTQLSVHPLLKLLSLDPTQTLYAEEFAIWLLVTLFLCFLYYLYLRLQKEIKIFLKDKKGLSPQIQPPANHSNSN
ncbi:hypothetical protein NEHOM01_2472 [Nematocida homosporus]|uniref:uncharacterized protein n=1 Tax=Nematocida homosporus TaxID=1912981 RepID=UPI00221EBB25|nr:uncharacterized protein NEHOM01_2472 [Nematocida homosporus]KAI5187979.1 hypothetical protein NEHOM01_2472 [Nematocida homosporus]